MHWERKNVNPMLALRNAICNDRWKEMWQKAVLHHRKLQALQRSARTERQAQALLAVGSSSSPKSLPQSVDASKPLSPPSPSQIARSAESPSVTSLPPALTATRSNSCHLSSRRKKHTIRNRVKYSHQRSGDVSREVCHCGTPLVRFKGHRTREYCSDRCRQRAYRQRQAEMS
jgi:hypothetical protein